MTGRPFSISGNEAGRCASLSEHVDELRVIRGGKETSLDIGVS
jgi:hypothetical protein